MQQVRHDGEEFRDLGLALRRLAHFGGETMLRELLPAFLNREVRSAFRGDFRHERGGPPRAFSRAELTLLLEALPPERLSLKHWSDLSRRTTLYERMKADREVLEAMLEQGLVVEETSGDSAPAGEELCGLLEAAFSADAA